MAIYNLDDPDAYWPRFFASQVRTMCEEWARQGPASTGTFKEAVEATLAFTIHMSEAQWRPLKYPPMLRES